MLVPLPITELRVNKAGALATLAISIVLTLLIWVPIFFRGAL